MDDLREALARSLFDVVSGREMVADMLMRELRAYAAREDVVERVARRLYAREHERSVLADQITARAFGREFRDMMEPFEENADMWRKDAQAALAAFLGEET